MSQGLSRKKIIIDWKWQRIQIWRSPVLNFWVKQGKSFIQVSPKAKLSAGWSPLFIGTICKQSWKSDIACFRDVYISYGELLDTNCVHIIHIPNAAPPSEEFEKILRGYTAACHLQQVKVRRNSDKDFPCFTLH